MLSIKKASLFHGVKYTTIFHGINKNESKFKGFSGRSSLILTPDEEKQIVEHIQWKAEIGYGVTWTMLELLIQEVLLAVTATNPHRRTGWEDWEQLAGHSWLHRFAKRNNVVLSATSGISKGWQVISPEDLALWQQDTWNFFSSRPELLEALFDPNRMWNQDETAIELGSTLQHVLANKGTKILYSVISNT